MFDNLRLGMKVYKASKKLNERKYSLDDVALSSSVGYGLGQMAGAGAKKFLTRNPSRSGIKRGRR